MVILGHNLGNSQVSVYRTIGPTLVERILSESVRICYVKLLKAIVDIHNYIMEEHNFSLV